MGDSDGAKTDFQESLKLAPSFTQTWVKIASVYMEQGSVEKASEAFDEAIKHNASDPDIYYHRGQGVLLNCWHNSCAHSAAVYFIMGDFAKAAENYTESTKLDDTFVFSHIQLAVALYKLGDVPKSKATFIRTLEDFKDRSEPPNY